jgi:chitin synthase
MLVCVADFWMIKSAQNVIGSVMCCPGCFSLYRAGAVRDIIAYYAGPTQHPFDVFVKDTGRFTSLTINLS